MTRYDNLSGAVTVGDAPLEPLPPELVKMLRAHAAGGDIAAQRWVLSDALGVPYHGSGDEVQRDYAALMATKRAG